MDNNHNYIYRYKINKYYIQRYYVELLSDSISSAIMSIVRLGVKDGLLLPKAMVCCVDVVSSNDSRGEETTDDLVFKKPSDFVLLTLIFWVRL